MSSPSSLLFLLSPDYLLDTVLPVAHFLLAISSLLFFKTNSVRWINSITHSMDAETTASRMWIPCPQTPRCGGYSRIPTHCYLPMEPPQGYTILPSPYHMCSSPETLPGTLGRKFTPSFSQINVAQLSDLWDKTC